MGTQNKKTLKKMTTQSKTLENLREEPRKMILWEIPYQEESMHVCCRCPCRFI